MVLCNLAMILVLQSATKYQKSVWERSNPKFSGG